MTSEQEMGFDRKFGDEIGRTSLRNILKNMHGYYKQFFPRVKRAMELAREPMEKELKDKIKLGRWEDRTYYRLKDTTEMSHRHLAKII